MIDPLTDDSKWTLLGRSYVDRWAEAMDEFGRLVSWVIRDALARRPHRISGAAHELEYFS